MGGERLLLIDGHALVYRAFFAMPALTNSKGELTNAAFGFTSMLLKVFNEHQLTHAVAAFDPPGPTFRHEQYTEYKAHRARMPDDLRPQVPWCQDICTVLGIPIVEVPRFEADDVIGTLATQAEAAGLDVMILTGDLDSLQLVTEHVVVYASRRGISDTIVYDIDKVHERYGFEPLRVVDFKALCGDTSDNIPGVPGIGEKTAMALVQQYGDLEQILAAVPTMKEGKVKRLLTEYAGQARQSQDLATIRRDVDVVLDREGSRLTPYSDAAVQTLFDRLEFRSLLPRLPVFDGGRPAQTSLQMAEPRPVVDVEVLQRGAIAADVLAALGREGPVAVQTAVSEPARRGTIAGIAVCSTDDDATAYFIPMGDSLYAADAETIAAVERLLADASVEKWGYDVKRDLLAWRQIGVEVRGLTFDAMLAAYLVNTRTRVAPMHILAEELCGLDITSDDELLGTGRQRRALLDVPVDELAQHFGGAAAAISPVVAALRRQLEEASLLAMHDDLEFPLVAILAAMEQTGVKVDPAVLGVISVEMGARMAEIEASVHTAVGHEFNLGSTQQLAAVLYDELGLASGRKTKTGRSTDADTLDALRDEHPAVAGILEWRQLTKLKGTYVDSLPLLAERDGRIHTSFNQAVATTGRLSSADPNLQNIPVRSDWGRRIRGAFDADTGQRLISADYSQIELRVLAHVSEEPALLESFRHGEDIHRRTAAQVYGVAPEAVTADMRRIAKVVNFGVLYGLSDFGLARDTGMSRAEAAAFIEAYFGSFPQVTLMLERIRNHAREWGWVDTIMGRRRWLPDIRAANRQVRQAAERMAVNMPMQGAAADIMKRAMIRADTALRDSGSSARMLLQVHDELVVEAPESSVDAVVALLRDAMEGAADLLVPLDVDVKVGANWADMSPLAAPVAAAQPSR